MRNIKLLSLFLSLFSLALFSCDKSDDSGNSGNNGGGVVPASGKWKITYFFDKKDETSNYTGYTFEFSSNGSLTATNGSQTWSGTWKTGVDDSKNKFVIDFNGSIPSALEDLEEDWLIIKIDDKLIHLEHTSGGNGDTDVVKFERK